jgi:alpha-glucosidase
MRQKKNSIKFLINKFHNHFFFRKRYFGDGDREGSHIPFNFDLIFKVDINSTAKHYKDTVESWINQVPKGHQPNWVVCYMIKKI